MFKIDSPRTPNTPAGAAQELRRHADDYRESDWPSYGAPLPEVIDAAQWDNWLEAAVLAGYVPDFEALFLAARGVHVNVRETIAESLRSGAEGDAIGWTHHADWYRELIQQLEAQIIDLERENARIHLLPLGADARPEHLATQLSDAAAAERRIDLAEQRLVLLALDTAPPFIDACCPR